MFDEVSIPCANSNSCLSISFGRVTLDAAIGAAAVGAEDDCDNISSLLDQSLITTPRTAFVVCVTVGELFPSLECSGGCFVKLGAPVGVSRALNASLFLTL